MNRFLKLAACCALICAASPVWAGWVVIYANGTRPDDKGEYPKREKLMDHGRQVGELIWENAKGTQCLVQRFEAVFRANDSTFFRMHPDADGRAPASTAAKLGSDVCQQIHEAVTEGLTQIVLRPEGGMVDFIDNTNHPSFESVAQNRN